MGVSTQRVHPANPSTIQSCDNTVCVCVCGGGGGRRRRGVGKKKGKRKRKRKRKKILSMALQLVGCHSFTQQGQQQQQQQQQQQVKGACWCLSAAGERLCVSGPVWYANGLPASAHAVQGLAARPRCPRPRILCIKYVPSIMCGAALLTCTFCLHRRQMGS